MKHTQEEELIALLKDHLTLKEIASRRKISVRAIQKQIKKLKDKGILMGSSLRGFVFRSTTTPSPKTNLIRLHGQEFNLTLKFKGSDYQPNKILTFENCTIRTFNNSVEVYSLKSFYGKSGYETKKYSIDYFNSYFLRLADYLNVYFKSVREVNAHYSEVENELAQDYNKKGAKLYLKGSDHKTWLKVDFSLKENELELVHPQRSLEDTDKVIKPFFDSLRDKPFTAYDFRDLYNLTEASIKNQERYMVNIENHLKAIEEMRLTMKAIREGLNKLSKD